jgi:hypothetical protein
LILIEAERRKGERQTKRDGRKTEEQKKWTRADR